MVEGGGLPPVSRIKPALKTATSVSGQVGKYRGEVGTFLERGITQYEHEWNTDFRDSPTLESRAEFYKFDKLLLEQLEHAQVTGRHDVVLFDFGCGKANLFRDLLSRKPESMESLRFLQEHPDIKLHLRGVTDSIGILDGDHVIPGQEEQIPVPPQWQNHIDAAIYYQAITASSTLGQFLEDNGIGHINLGLATQVFSYLSPNVFKEVLETMTDRLTGGGRIIASPYAGRAYGFRGDSRGSVFDIHSDTDRSGLARVLQHGANLFLYPNKFGVQNLSAEREAFLKVLKKFVENGIIPMEKLEAEMQFFDKFHLDQSKDVYDTLRNIDLTNQDQLRMFTGFVSTMVSTINLNALQASVDRSATKK